MATVYLGRMVGPAGFSKTVAIKRVHPHFAGDAEFARMLLDEARVAARLQHPNVVSTIDVVASEGELFLVMEHVLGVTLSKLLRACSMQGMRCPPRVATRIVSDVLHGLQHAHEALGADGAPLELIHRDISPQNVVVGADGVSRVLDFGIAKSVGRLQSTREGEIKGKLPYAAPELFGEKAPTQQIDVYAAGVVLWEALAGRRLFTGDSDVEVVGRILHHVVPLVSEVAPDQERFDAVVARAIAREPSERFPTARAFALALEQCGPLATANEVAELVNRVAGELVTERSRLVAALDRTPVDPGAGDSVKAIEQAAPTVLDVTPAPELRASTLRTIALTGAVILGAVGGFLWLRPARPVATDMTGASATPVASAPAAADLASAAAVAASVSSTSPPPPSASTAPSMPPAVVPAARPVRTKPPARPGRPSCVPKKSIDAEGRTHYSLPPGCTE